MPTPDPETPTALQTRTQLHQAADLLQRIADSAHPQQQLLAERDHYARMWDELKEEVLQNLQQIRDEQTRLRCDLQDAGNAGGAGTERILMELKSLRGEVELLRNTCEAAYRCSTNQPAPKAAAPWWRPW